MHPQLVQAQFGVGTRTSEDRKLQRMRPTPVCRDWWASSRYCRVVEKSQKALMWLHPRASAAFQLLQAPALLTGEATVPALQRGLGLGRGGAGCRRSGGASGQQQQEQ